MYPTLRSPVSRLLLPLGLLLLLAACSASESKPGATLRDINDSFKDPTADPQRWVDRFEVESREVFAARLAILDALDLEAGDRVADVGAGTGLFVELIADRVGAGGKVIAVDISPSLIEHMRGRFAGRGEVEIVASEETSTRLEPSSVGKIFTSDTYHHFTYYREMLASIHQALTPSGELMILDFERLPGVSEAWLLDHVRAGKEQVIEEVEAAGFSLVEEVEVPGLKENYFLRFRKL